MASSRRAGVGHGGAFPGRDLAEVHLEPAGGRDRPQRRLGPLPELVAAHGFLPLPAVAVSAIGSGPGLPAGARPGRTLRTFAAARRPGCTATRRRVAWCCA